MLLMIDNYDSFTYNLVQYFGQLGQEVDVVRNDELNVDELQTKNADYLVVSPGPGKPQQAGVSIDAIKAFSGKIPILGVCLGHQCIGEAFGTKPIHADKLMHGKTDAIFHQGGSVFKNIPSPFIATRYHSLIVEEEGLLACLKPTAHTKVGELMAVEHRDEPTVGLQFHPESICTEKGLQILQNFLDLR